MYLHLGSDISVSVGSVVAIMDLENTSTSEITQEYLMQISKKGDGIDVKSDELPKSYVITFENGVQRVYVSPISCATLLKRAENFDLMLKTLKYYK